MSSNEFPTRRMRRNRYYPTMRRMISEHDLSVDDLIQPLFVKENIDEPEPIPTMPGHVQHTLESIVEAVKKCEKRGIPAVILFGVPEEKDEVGTEASHEHGIIQEAFRRLEGEVDEILLIGDVCLCEYTDHGHCGILRDREVDNDATLERLVETAISQVEAGADVVAPSDMMDGRVQAIRDGLDEAGHHEIPIMSYAVKYASSFYGPFREAAESPPQFGDRRSYQMDPPNRREAIREARLDVKEGADWLMVKPALPYLDIVRDVREEFELPLAAYCVSGEFSMVEAAAQREWVNRKNVVLESLTGMKRAGADVILTYWAKNVAEWLQ
ncbi:MAG: porphobilinogen synthase [bacterium]